MQKIQASRVNGTTSFNFFSHRKEKSVTCQECGTVFTAFLDFELCDDCAEKLDQEQSHDAVSRAKIARRDAFWEQVPPLYRKTDKTRLNPVLVSAIANWQFSPKGIGFVGAAGSGKTRAAVLILAKASESGHSTLYLPATELSAVSAGAFADSAVEREICKRKLVEARKVKCLLLDDLGKGRLTDRAESELYDILETRTSHELPTLWTSNSNAQGLRSMFSADRADALIRRLGKEFCTHITL